MKKFTYQLLLLFLISGVGSAQTPVMLKLGYETFDEVIKEHGLHYKATQDYDDYLKFRQSSLRKNAGLFSDTESISCLLYTSPSPRDQRGSRMPSSA